MQAVFSLQSILSAEWRAKMKSLNLTTLTIAVIGAINWGLIGLFSFDLVAWLFGDMHIPRNLRIRSGGTERHSAYN